MSKKVTQKTTQVREKKFLGTWILLGMTAFVCFFCINGVYVNASELNIGENIANWLLDQIFWIVLVLGIYFAAMAGIKRAWVTFVSIIVVTAIMLVIIAEPTIVKDLGDKLLDIIGL